MQRLHSGSSDARCGERSKRSGRLIGKSLRPRRLERFLFLIPYVDGRESLGRLTKNNGSWRAVSHIHKRRQLWRRLSPIEEEVGVFFTETWLGFLAAALFSETAQSIARVAEVDRAMGMYKWFFWLSFKKCKCRRDIYRQRIGSFQSIPAAFLPLHNYSLIWLPGA